ncbi:MAG: EI24 domain-containing protein [Desulfobulbaceae bacterium]
MSFVSLVRKTLHSLGHRGMVGLMFLCAVLAVLVVLALWSGLTWLTANLVTLERSWLDTAINWLVGIVLGIGGWFMLPVLVILISAAFQEITISKVEQADYPDMVRAGEPHLWTDLRHDIRFTLKALLLNLLVVPFYFIGIGFLLSILLNSYLLGREFFENAAGYHLGKPGARELGRRHKKQVYGSGLLITLLTLLPVANLFAPIIAMVWMVHVHHAINPGLSSGSSGAQPSGRDLKGKDLGG